MVFGHCFRKAPGSKEPVSIRTFQTRAPDRILLQDPRILHDFREALGGTQGYVLQLHGFPWRILLQDPRILYMCFLTFPHGRDAPLHRPQLDG